MHGAGAAPRRLCGPERTWFEPRVLAEPVLESRDPKEAVVDWKLELVAIPVSDVDRAKAFYVDQAGFHADHDHTVSEEIRFVQLTPPGSACSIALGTGITDAAPGSVAGVQLVVDDIQRAHQELAERGVEVSDVQEFPWGSFVFFSDPDGNRWSVQQVAVR
jgi:catechol 2,3-dioxygenase-like lactoylglutathione lyase family enzyme